MRLLSHHHKYTVASVFLAVGISGPAIGQDALIDDLMGQLQEAEPGGAERIVAAIQTEWAKVGSPSVELLFRRGEDALAAGEFLLAAEHFTAAIDHAPEFTEAYNGRASAYYRQGLVGPALADLGVVIAQNPQHFVAIFGFGVIMEETGRHDAAEELYLRVLDLHPTYPGAQEAVDRVREELSGEAL